MAALAPRLRAATTDDVGFLAYVVLLSHEKRYASRPGWNREDFYRGLLEDAADQVACRLGFVHTGDVNGDRRRMLHYAGQSRSSASA